MYKRLTKEEKIEIIKRAISGGKIAVLARETGISRTILYKWLKQYQTAKTKAKRAVLSARVVRGKKHWNSFNSSFEKKIIKSALNNPNFSVREVVKAVNSDGVERKASANGVWKVLKRAGLDSRSGRDSYIYRYGRSVIKPVEVNSKAALLRRYEDGERISSLCREFKVSRTLFYRFLKRYKEANLDTSALRNLRPKAERHWRFVPEVQNLIIGIVNEHPEFSAHKISGEIYAKTGKKLMGHNGVHNLLKRLNLNTYQKRFVFAESNAGSIAKIPEVVREEKTPIGSIPTVSSLAPPSFFGRFFSTKFLLPFLLIFLASLSTYILLSSIFNTHSFVQKIGMVFAFTSLVFGMFFFIYSLKYYITIAAVLSFSRNKQRDLPAGRQGQGKKGFLSNLFGLVSGKTGSQGQVYKNGAGLDPKLSEVFLKREPFVSIHLASYNEKRVINRLLTAVTSLDYKNYEVIVADDSTDETKDLLKTWSKNPRVIISHREERTGYKGAALAEALKKTDPRAEFIIVFDADFIPYPDTINQFLRYFQSLVGGLSSQELKDSNIAAIQGYQWHVLNKSENWITRGVRSEYSGSYVIERSGEEIYGGLKQISGSVYMIRRDVLDKIGWGHSITEDFELTLKLYEKGYKVVYTPYIQAPAEAVSTFKRLIRQRMRWAEGHSHNVRNMFRRLMFSNNLTTGEKLEFAYLTPYYLQAAFFIAGTLCWFLSETIFQVRLPFWTDVWGWSLVLTNLFALPLMNMVGMFLEEAEEKDYMGLLSFVALSYLVAPFQAYAAVKGFMEEEEGPWFRTPKTGRITDTFAPNRFYKFVFGVFGKGQPTVETSKFGVQSFINQRPFLPNFNPAVLRPKKFRRIGRSAVVLTLIFTLGLNLLSFNQDLFNLRQNSNQKGEATIEGKKDFLESQIPQFKLKIPKESGKVSWYEKLLPGQAIAAEPKVTATILNLSNQPVNISPKIVKVGQDYTIIIPDAINLRPGKYKLNTFWRDQNGFQHTSSQDFTWGVLAINTNKSIYAEGETAELGFGTLDDKGKTLCDSDLNLDITSPDGQKTSLSSDNGQIKQSGKCAVTSVTNTADYLTQYQTDKTGTYKLHLTATTQNGKRSIDDKFEVKDSKDIPFDVERVSYPTRIYPISPYAVQIKVTANRDFKGTIEEAVPSSFEISRSSNSTIEQFSNVTTRGNKKVISWNVDLRKGEIHNLSYTINFPNISPEFYLVGPLRFKTEDLRLKTKTVEIFAEQRQWQIASDAVAIQFIETPDATQGQQFWSSASGLVYYDNTNKKSGLASWQATSQASNTAAYLRKKSVLADGAGVGRRISAYFLFGGLPTAGTTRILTIVPSSVGADILSLRLTTGGVLQFWNNTAQIGTNGSTIVAGNWYRFVVSYTITSTTQNEIRLFKDGNSTADISITNATLSNTGGTDLMMGWGNAPGANLGEVFQHVYVDNATTLDDPGDIRVTAKLPTTVGNSGWTATGTGAVNERPISTTNGMHSTGSTQTQDYSLEAASAGDVNISSATIVGYDEWIWSNRASGSAPTNHLIADGTQYSITVGTSNALFQQITTSSTYPTSTHAVGEDQTSGSTQANLYEAGALVAYNGTAVPEEALLLAPLAFFAPKLIKSIQQGTVVEDMTNLLRKFFKEIGQIVLRLIVRKKKRVAVIKRKKKRGG